MCATGFEIIRLSFILLLSVQVAAGECPARENGFKDSIAGWIDDKICPKSLLTEMDETDQAPEFILIAELGDTRLAADISASELRRRGFNPHKPITIFIHGYRESAQADWLQRSRALIRKYKLERGGNFIIMDWGKASAGFYPAVVAKAALIANYLAEFVLKLTRDLGADPMSIHLIGHSLGGQLSGLAGRSIRPKLGRITALDAAGPCFDKSHHRERLSLDDAYQVDSYHYDDDLLGLRDQLGQFDIYVNGGHRQPGCVEECPVKKSIYLVNALLGKRQTNSIRHTRSTEVASADLGATTCQQVAYRCADYQSFLNGECGTCDDDNNQCFLMGFKHQYGLTETIKGDRLRSSTVGKRLYIATGSSDIYCLNHYQILVKFSDSEEFNRLAKQQMWHVKLTLTDAKGQQLEVKLSNRVEYNLFSHLLVLDGDLEPFEATGGQLELQQANGAPARKPNSIRALEVKVNFMSSIEPERRRSLSLRLCPSAEKQKTSHSKSGEVISLAKC